MVRRILVGLDGSPLAETIVDPVRALARSLRAEMVLLHVTPVPEIVRGAAGPGLDRMIAEERERAQTYLRAPRITEAGVTVRTAVCAGEPAAEIVRYAEHEQIDLIALATHGRSGMERWLYGSVADAVLHATKTPLLLLRPRRAGAEPFQQIRRLVVPLDGSPLAETALGMAEELARAVDAQLLLLRAVEFPGMAFGADPFGSPYLDCQKILDALREEAERYLAEPAEQLRRKGLTVATRASVGMPVETITAEARKQPGSVIVMTTHGRSGWRAALLGSVARRVVALADSPVLVLRPPASVSKPLAA